MVRAVLMGTIIFNALAFSVESLFPVVATEHLEVGPELTGVLISAQSFGTLGAALAIGLVPNLRYHGRVFCFGMAIQLVTLTLFALSPWYPLSFVSCCYAPGWERPGSAPCRAPSSCCRRRRRFEGLC